MKLTHIAATLYSLKWGRHIDTRPAIASLQREAMQHQAQLRKKQKAFKNSHGKATQVKEL